MNYEEEHGRRPWSDTEPMWSPREIEMRKVKKEGSSEAFRQPEHIKVKQAESLKKRFEKYSGLKPISNESQFSKWSAFLALAVIGYAVYRWRRGH